MSRTISEIMATYWLKIANFSALVWGDPLGISGKLMDPGSRGLHRPDSEDFVILVCIILIRQQGVMDGRTDGQTPLL